MHKTHTHKKQVNRDLFPTVVTRKALQDNRVLGRDETDEWQGSGPLISYQLNKEFIFLVAAVNTIVRKN